MSFTRCSNGCGHLCSVDAEECDQCLLYKKAGNGDYWEGKKIIEEQKVKQENFVKFSKIKRPGKKLKADLDSYLYRIHVSITPRIGNASALPIPTEAQVNNEEILVRGWRGIVELVCEEVNNEPGVECSNAMEMSASCSFEVNLQDNETPRQAEKRVKKAFTKAWDKIVDNVERGRKL